MTQRLGRLLPNLSLEAFLWLVEDISYFVDVAHSTTFVAKEHVIVDKKITVPPLPKPVG